MSHTRQDKSDQLSHETESKQIYAILAKVDLDKQSRYALLNKYRRSDEGLQLLVAALVHAKQEKQKAIKSVRHDPDVRYLADDDDGYRKSTAIPNRVIEDLEYSIRMGKLIPGIPYTEPSKIYDMLASQNNCETGLRYKSLKAYRQSDEGLRLLTSALEYARQKEQDAIRRVKQDPEDRSGYNDYLEKTRIPKQVIDDLSANITMTTLAKSHSFWHKNNSHAQPDIGQDATPKVNL